MALLTFLREGLVDGRTTFPTLVGILMALCFAVCVVMAIGAATAPSFP